MGKLTSVKPHLSEYEISEKLRASTGGQHRRWLVIWNALVDPREAKHIALHTGLSVPTAHNLPHSAMLIVPIHRVKHICHVRQMSQFTHVKPDSRKHTRLTKIDLDSCQFWVTYSYPDA